MGLTSTKAIYQLTNELSRLKFLHPCVLRQRDIMAVETTGGDQMRLNDPSGFPAEPLSATFQF